MDGSSVGTVVTLHNATDNTFLFTIDYSQQMLCWMNSTYNNNCYYINYIERANTDGSGREIVYNASTLIGNCTNNSYHNSYSSQAIDYFGGAVYMYTRDVFKAIVVDTQNIVTYDSVNWYRCNSTYTALKIVSPKRQLKGNDANCIIMLYALISCIHCRYKPLRSQQWWLCSSLPSQ